MTGLDRILEQIIEEANEAVQEKKKEADRAAEDILAAAQKDAAQQAHQILADAEDEADKQHEKILSAAHFEQKNRMLVFKQSYIETVIRTSMEQLEALPDEEYFAMIEKLLKKHALKLPGQVVLGEKDIKRLPKGYEEKMSAAAGAPLAIRKAAGSIASGFVLEYDGIDVNCSIRSLFESEMEELRDKAAELLFPG